MDQGDGGYCWTDEETGQELCVCDPGYYGVSCNIEGVYYASGVMAGLLVIGILLVFAAQRVEKSANAQMKLVSEEICM